MEGRIIAVYEKHRERKRKREEEAKALNEIKIQAQITKVVELLESAESLPITIETTSICAEARKELENYFKFTAVSTDDDDYYHSLWKIDV